MGKKLQDVVDSIDRLTAELEAAQEKLRQFEIELVPRYMVCNEHPYLHVTDPLGSALGCPECKLRQLREGLAGLKRYVLWWHKPPARPCLVVDESGQGGWLCDDELRELLDKEDE